MSEASSQSGIRSLFPFLVMCFGGFMALLDIQIVASSLQHIGGGLSAAQDEISWVQTAYLIAEIIVIPLSGWLTRVFSTRWLFTASAACCAGSRGSGADSWSNRRRLDHRYVELALAVLCQSCARHRDHAVGAACGPPTNDHDVGQVRIHADEGLAQCCQIPLQPAIE
jgi:MFS family permease